MHVRSAGFCEDVRVRCHILPPDHQEHAQTARVEMVELSGVSAIHCLSFTSTMEGGENNGAVNLQLRSKADFSALSSTCFGSPAVDLDINADSSRELLLVL